jgi:F-type H+-transporting ATPase subunit epsilon
VSKTILVTVLSPERRLLENVEITRAHFNTSEGEIEVLPDHIQMVGTLETGMFEFTLAKDQALTSGVFSSGFFRLSGGHLTVTAETIELKGEISVDRARQAQQKALKMLSEASLTASDFRKYELKLQRALIRQSAVN